MNILTETLETGLAYSLMVLALFLSYSMLGVCDLSTDGCFTLGMAVGAMVTLAGYPFLAPFAAMAAGACSGVVTAWLQTRMGINSLLAGIIVNTALFSVNMTILGGAAQVNMNKADTVFTVVKQWLAGTFLVKQYKLTVLVVVVGLAIAFLVLFLQTRLGLAIRATGDNPIMVRSSSINPAFTTTVGLCIAGALTGLSGCLWAQMNKRMDIKDGTGVVTIALASLLIGSTLLRRGMLPRAIGMVVGSVTFHLVYAGALQLHVSPHMLKLVSAVIVVIALSVPYFQQQWSGLRRRLSARKGGG